MTLRLVGVVGELDVVANFVSCAAGLHRVFSIMDNRIRESIGGILILPILKG